MMIKFFLFFLLFPTFPLMLVFPSCFFLAPVAVFQNFNPSLVMILLFFRKVMGGSLFVKVKVLRIVLHSFPLMLLLSLSSFFLLVIIMTCLILILLLSLLLEVILLFTKILSVIILESFPRNSSSTLLLIYFVILLLLSLSNKVSIFVSFKTFLAILP